MQPKLLLDNLAACLNACVLTDFIYAGVPIQINLHIFIIITAYNKCKIFLSTLHK